jgi:hypothetical protein
MSTPGHKYVMVCGGTLIFADLYAVSPTFRAAIGSKLDALLAKATVTWWLTTGMDGRSLKFSSIWDTWIAGRLAYLVKPEVVNCTGSRSTDAAVGRSARRAASV